MPDDGRPIRIAFCITDLDPGGAERALVQIVTRLDRRRWEPAVFCLSGEGALVEPLRRAGIPVNCLGARGVRDMGVIFRLCRELRRFQPKIVQTFLFHANIVGRLAARMGGVPICVSGIRVAEKRSRWPLRLDRLTNRLVRTNVCVSQGVADYSAQVAGLSRDKIVVIPNGVDFKLFAEALPLEPADLGLPAGAVPVLFVGRLDPQKGLIHLVEAARQLVPQRPALHFLLVGEGPEREALTRSISEAGLTGRMHLLGWRGDVPRLLRSACCLVLPSLWEGMPNVVLEAMAAALPVVATRVEGIAELVIPDQTGWLVEPGQAPPLAEAIETLLGDPVLANAMGLQGQSRAKAAFSWEKAVADYESLYGRLVTEADCGIPAQRA